MRLPQHQSGQVQSLQGVDPGTYRQAGEDAAAFGAGISSVAEAAHQAMLERDVQAGKMANHAQRQQLAELKAELETNEYLPADSPLLEGVENYNTRPDGTVLTSEVAAQIYENQATSYANANAENMRDGRVRRTWEESQRSSIAEQTANITISAEKAAKQERKKEDINLIEQAIASQDWEGAKQAIAMSGLNDREKAEVRLAAKKQRELANADNAMVERDLGKIRAEMKTLGQTQEDYEAGGGKLDVRTRLQKLNQLESAERSIAKASEGASKAQGVLARRDLKTTLGSVWDGDISNIRDLSNMLEEKAALAFDGDPDSWSNEQIRLAADLSDIMSVSPYVEAMGMSNHAQRNDIIRQAEADGVPKHLVAQLRDLGGKLDVRADDDAIRLAQDQGLLPPVPAYDPSNPGWSVNASATAGAVAQQIYGGDQQAMTEADGGILKRQLDQSTVDERIGLYQQLGQGVEGDKALMWDISKKVAGSDHTDHKWTEIYLSGQPNGVDIVRRQAEGRELLNTSDGQRQLASVANNYGEKQQTAMGVNLQGDLAPHFPDPIVRNHMVTAGEELVAGYVGRNMKPKAARKQAVADLVGGNTVRGMAGGPQVRPPAPGVTTSEFRTTIRRADDEFFKDNANISGDRSLSLAIRTGDVQVVDAEVPGTYHMKYSGTGDWVLDDDGNTAVLKYDEIPSRPDQPERSGFKGWSDRIGSPRGELYRPVVGD